MANKLIQLKDGNDNVYPQRKYEDIDVYANGGIPEGIIGTRGGQTQVNVSAQPISAQIIWIQQSASYIPIVFLYNNENMLFVNWYRGTTNAVAEANTKITVRVFFN